MNQNITLLNTWSKKFCYTKSVKLLGREERCCHAHFSSV